MRNPLADKVTTIKPSGIRKFFDIVQEIDDAISLGVGEPDFDTPWHIRDEGIYSLEKGRTFYTSNLGLKDLRTEVCNYLKRTFILLGRKYLCGSSQKCKSIFCSISPQRKHKGGFSAAPRDGNNFIFHDLQAVIDSPDQIVSDQQLIQVITSLICP